MQRQTKHHRINALDYANCDGCPLSGRPVVHGYGNIHSPDIAFVAEAPGETEVEEGIPLVGKSGSFLRQVIRDIGIDEAKCYFTNACLSHPENNATPSAAAAKACYPRLVVELNKIRPKLIVTLGSVSAKSLGDYRLGIKKSHGTYKSVMVGGLAIGIIPVFHPAFILREPTYFQDFVDELELAKKVVNGLPPVVEPPYENYVFIRSQSEFEEFLPLLASQTHAACDIETDSTDYLTSKILCIGFSWEKEHAWVVDWSLLEQNIENTEKLNRMLLGVKLAFHNGIFDVPFMIYNGLTNTDYYMDTMQLHYLLDERQETHGLERLATKYYRSPQYKTLFRTSVGIRNYQSESEIFSHKFSDADPDKLFAYNGADCDYTYRLAVDLAKEVKAEGFNKVLHGIEMPSSRCFTQFYMDGMLIDRDYLEGLGKKWRAEIREMRANIIASTGDPEFNPNSVPQLAHHLYDVLKLAPFGGREQLSKPKIDENIITACISSVTDDEEAIDFWTKRRTSMSAGMKVGKDVKGLPSRSTSAYMLYWLRRQHDFPNWVLKLRHAMKRYSLYYNGLKKSMKVDGRVHPKYSLVATKTGRKATNDPAIHNIPRGDEIYNIFIPEPGWCLLHADYSQAEMRMMAQYSGDRALIHMLNTSDPHTTMAKKMFHVPDKEWDKLDKQRQGDMRIAAKMVCLTPNHLVLTANCEWVPVGELKIGQRLIAFTENTDGFQGKRRKWEFTEVTSNARQKAKVYNVHLSDGSVITTTGEHRWLTKATSWTGGQHGTRWVRTDHLRGGGGIKSTKLPRMMTPWHEEMGKLAGYVQGVFDSEGSIDRKCKYVTYCQRDNVVLARTQKILGKFNVESKMYDHWKDHDDVHTVAIRGGFAKAIEFLGRFQPKRLIENFNKLDELASFTLPDRDSNEWVSVLKVETAGIQEVVLLATTTETFFGEGFPMHNTFGIPYGRSPAGLAPQLRISVEEARQYIEDYFAPFPDWKNWLDRQRQRGVDEKEITSIFGRKRRFPLIPNTNYGKEVQRMSGNMAIQSAINDLTLLAMINSGKALEDNHIPFHYWPHIHDSVNFTIPIPMWVAAVRIVLSAMTTIPFEHIVEFPCEIEIGLRWGDMITVHKHGTWQDLPTEGEVPDWMRRNIPHETTNRNNAKSNK